MDSVFHVFPPTCNMVGHLLLELKMSLFDWKPLFSVNISHFDSQHQQIVGYMNGFYAAHQNSNFPEAQKHLKDLLSFTQKHFSDEEEMMQKNAYPDLVAHQESHKNLLHLVTRLGQDFLTAPTAENGEKLGNFLKNWLAGHILGVDKKYGPYLTSKGIH